MFLLTDKPEKCMGEWTPDNDKLKKTILEDLPKLVKVLKARQTTVEDEKRKRMRRKQRKGKLRITEERKKRRESQRKRK